MDHKYYGHIILPASTYYNYWKIQTYFTLFSILYYEPRMMRMNLISMNRALTTKQLKKSKQWKAFVLSQHHKCPNTCSNMCITCIETGWIYVTMQYMIQGVTKLTTQIESGEVTWKIGRKYTMTYFPTKLYFRENSDSKSVKYTWAWLIADWPEVNSQ